MTKWSPPRSRDIQSTDQPGGSSRDSADRAGHAVEISNRTISISWTKANAENYQVAIVKSAGPTCPRPRPRRSTAPPLQRAPQLPERDQTVPTRFVAFVFDDLHMRTGTCRKCAPVLKYLSTSLRPGSRGSLYYLGQQESISRMSGRVSEPLNKISPSRLRSRISVLRRRVCELLSSRPNRPAGRARAMSRMFPRVSLCAWRRGV